ncbi:alanine racemase [Kribbella sp.]|uniref:alanine racemase n=1 Tax=Kribbella sp. TaxID=1871183 RepID=UPI002D3330DD|nr:alanine racemase [Kribbella sp.]HZX06655.1 alanine racemase [Kribbella sp.]
MFLKNLVAHNPAFAAAAIELHQSGELPPDTYVIDLDMLGTNAQTLCSEAHRLGLDVIAMTKQFGRNPLALETLRTNGVDSFVAVDMTCARAIDRAGQPVGHVGHLVQIPKYDASAAAAMRPENWTVFSDLKAAEAAGAAKEIGLDQRLLARVYDGDGMVIESHAGGFDADEIEAVADRFDALEGAHFGGITSYPALGFDREARTVVPTPNLRTLERTAERLRRGGRSGIAVNGPGETSTRTLATLADAGVTQVEPGHGFTATGAYHAFEELPERPAMLYLSEVSHLDGDSAFCFGGGLYLCIGSVDYQPQALVGRDFDSAVAQSVDATLSQNHQVIDFYGRLAQTPRRTLRPGDSVLFCFRAQAFYTRSLVAPVAGIQSGTPRVEGLYTVDGRPA